MKTVIRIGRVGLLMIAMLSGPSRLLAQSTNEPSTSAKRPHSTNQVSKAEKKPVAGPFHGKLLALDKVNKTITVGKRTFQITSETRIKKSGKPAKLEEGVVGEPVSGYVKPTPDAKWIAVSVNFGPKAQEGSPNSKKPKADQEPN